MCDEGVIQAHFSSWLGSLLALLRCVEAQALVSPTVPDGEAGGRRDVRLQGPKPVFFFAPAWVAQRLKDWGGTAGLTRRVGANYAEFVTGSSSWLQVRTMRGAAAVTEAFRMVMRGELAPSEGLILSLWDAPRSRL